VQKGHSKAILLWLGVVGSILCLAPGCSAPQSAVEVYLDAVMLRELGQNDLAIEKLKQVVETDPNFAFAYSEMGAVYRAVGDLDNAGMAFQRAAELDSWSFSDHMDLAGVRREQGRYAEAAAAYARAAELAPEDLAAQVGAARCYLRDGQAVRALVHCELARQMDEGSRDVVLLLAQVYEAQKDYDQAIAVYQQLLERAGDDVDVMLAMSVAYIENEQYGQSRDVLVALLRMRPDEAAAFRRLAYCYLKLGDTDEAIVVYEKAIEANANDWQAHRGLGVAYMVKARLTSDERWKQAALRHWREALAMNPDQPRREVLQRLIKEHSTTTNPLRGLDY